MFTLGPPDSVHSPLKRCRLLYLVGQLSPGGQERQLSYLLQAIDRERYQPAVSVWNFSEDDTFAVPIRALGVPLYSFPKNFSVISKLTALRRLVRVLKPEVLHSYGFYTNIAAYWGALGTPTVPIGSVRGDFFLDKSGCSPWLASLSGLLPRSQIFNSFLAKENARRSKSAFVPKQIFVVRNGLDLSSFRMVPLSPNGQVRIVATGSLMPYKRWDRLIAAVPILKQRGFDFLVRIIGDGPLRGSLDDQVQRLGVASNVEFVRKSDNIPSLLANATFIVHTSESEGCPNVVMEAMACGRAVVATDAGDIPNLIKDGETGFIVHRGEEALLVERIAMLISNPEMCRRMGLAGRAKAEGEFGLGRLVSETLSAYRAAGWKDF
jgi:glycosyltransferase involved in cell wall biosynthesis